MIAVASLAFALSEVLGLPVNAATSTSVCPALSPMPAPAFAFPNFAIWQWLAIVAVLAVLIAIGIDLSRRYFGKRTDRHLGLALYSACLLCLGIGSYILFVADPAWIARMSTWHLGELSRTSSAACYTVLDQAYYQATGPHDWLFLSGVLLLLGACPLLFLAFRLFARRRYYERQMLENGNREVSS